METYKILDKEYPIIRRIDCIIEETGEVIKDVPLVDIPQVSDYKWQLDCLNDRLEHPENYEEFEDVPATIEKLRKWLEAHKEEKSA